MTSKIRSGSAPALRTIAAIAAVAAIATVSAAAGLQWAPPALAQSSSAAPAGMAVTVTKTARTCFTDTLQVSGFLVPREEVFVRPEIEGLQVTKIEVEDGEKVTSGQILARLTRPDGMGPATTATVKAPSTGTVNLRFVRVGMMASARAPEPLFRVVVNGDVELQGDVPGARMSKLAVDQSARVELAGAGEATGKVRVVSPEVDSATQMGRVRVSVGNDERFKVGAYARAIVEVGRSCGTTVPLSAVLYGPEGAVVQVVRDDRVETRRVRVGLLSGGNAEIREGLNEGDMIVARAGAFLREGDRVRAIVGQSGSSTTTR